MFPFHDFHSFNVNLFYYFIGPTLSTTLSKTGPFHDPFQDCPSDCLIPE